MTRKTILIVGIDYWPDVTGIAPYTTQFAEYLAAQGDDVHVLTGMPYYPEWKPKSGYDKRLRMTEIHNGVTLHRRRQFIPRKQSALRRGAYEASFLLQSLFNKALPKPDVVIGVSPALADGIIAARIARKHNIPFGFWIQDLMGQAAIQSGVSGGHRVARATAKIEGWVANQATNIAIIAEGFRAPLESMGVKPENIHHVPNWSHIGEPTMTQEDARLALGLPRDKNICLHAGNMGLKQGLEAVVEAARVAQTEAPHLHFVLLGDGSQRSTLETLAAGLPNLCFIDPVSDEMFPNALHAADILLLSQGAEVKDMSKPSKLTSYYASGRPVISVVSPDSETRLEVEAAQAGVVIESGSPSLIVETLVVLLVDDERMRELGANGKKYQEERLVPEKAIKELSLVLELVP